MSLYFSFFLFQIPLIFTEGFCCLPLVQISNLCKNYVCFAHFYLFWHFEVPRRCLCFVISILDQLGRNYAFVYIFLPILKTFLFSWRFLFWTSGVKLKIGQHFCMFSLIFSALKSSAVRVCLFLCHWSSIKIGHHLCLNLHLFSCPIFFVFSLKLLMLSAGANWNLGCPCAW